jgi:teichuronic acid exporter
MASSLMNKVFDNLTSLVIGKVFSAAALGYYTRAVTLQDAASQSLASVANRVTFPVFSQLQNDPARMKRGLRKGMTTLAFIQFPLLLGLAAAAEPLVLLLLTEKWAPSIPYLQVLCFAGLLYPVHLLNLNVLVAMGRSDLFFRLGIVKRGLQVAAILITFRWGVLAMIWGQVITSLLSYFLNAYFTKRFIDYSIPEQLSDLLPYLSISVLMALAVYFTDLPLPAGSLLQLAFKVTFGFTIYATASRIFRLGALADLGELIRSRRTVPAC